MLAGRMFETAILQSVSRTWTSLTWLWWFGFRLKPIFDLPPLPQKIALASKVVQSALKIIILLNNQFMFLRHSVFSIKKK